MGDLSDKGSECDDMINCKSSPERGASSSSEGGIKTCADCGTSKTPLWRGGPAGPKSLCNACGIRSRKKRRALVGVTKDEKKAKKSMSSSCTSGGDSHSHSQSSGLTSSMGNFCLKRRVMGFGTEVVLQRPRSNQRRRKLGEEEQAAILLMALSCGSVFG